MKLGEGVEQAIHCVALLAGLSDEGVVPAPALAEHHGVSTSYLLKHLQALTGAGILVSVPGPKGGYRLARAPEDITLLDIVLAIEGPEPAFRCAEIRQRGPMPLDAKFFRRPCGINAAMSKAEQVYRAELRKVSIADINGPSNPELDAALAERGCAFFQIHERRTNPDTRRSKP